VAAKHAAADLRQLSTPVSLQTPAGLALRRAPQRWPPQMQISSRQGTRPATWEQVFSRTCT